MSVTGVILWFDNTFLGLLTKLWWDVARTVHYYEAWLATLAIIVWHFYFVIFNPDVLPDQSRVLEGDADGGGDGGGASAGARSACRRGGTAQMREGAERDGEGETR